MTRRYKKNSYKESYDKRIQELEDQLKELQQSYEQIQKNLDEEKNKNQKHELGGLTKFFDDQKKEEGRLLLDDSIEYSGNDPFPDKHDVILLALSILPPRLVASNWKYNDKEEEEEYTDCIGQMECVLRHFLKKSPQKKAMDVIVLCTEDTTNKLRYNIYGERLQIEGGQSPAEESPETFEFSTYDFLKYRIRKADESDGKTIRFQKVVLDENDVYPVLKEAVTKTRESILTDGDNQLFIDTHGAFREVSLLLNAVVFLLGKTDEESRIVPAEICGVQTFTHKIVNQTETYHIFDFVTGITDFVNYGNADVLNEYFKKDNEELNIVGSMNAASLALQMCDSEQFSDNLKNLNNMFAQANPLLDIFSDQIKADFGELLREGITKSDRDFWIIQRCVDKKMYQQALTMIESNLPNYYNEKKLLYYEERTPEAVTNHNTEKGIRSDQEFFFNYYLKYHCPFFIDQNDFDGTDDQNNRHMVYQQRAFQLLQMIGNDKWDSTIDSSTPTRDGIKYVWPSNQSMRIETPESNVRDRLTVKTNVSEKCYDTLGYALRIHKALKEYRNAVNHATVDRPPLIKLDEVVCQYLELLKKLAQDVQEN